MLRQLGGVVLAAVVLFIWGFVYWGVSAVPYSAWSHAADDTAAQQALRTHFPRTGTYYVPDVRSSAARPAAASGADGPNVMLHVRYDAPPPGDAAELARGFVVNLIFAGALALLMYRVRSASRTYAGRLGVALWAGVAGVVLIDGGDWAWWGTTMQWKLFQAFYDFSAFVLAGAVLAAFIRGEVRRTRYT